MSLFLCLGKGEEAVRCVRCGANQRYELLAEYINEQLGSALENLDVVEFDPNSPLSRILNKSRKYVQTYYSENCSPGSRGADGARCEDLTKLTFEDNSLDLMVSSDVLEHIPDVAAAFEECARVLRKGGMHIFTVPTHDKTFRRAQIKDGKVVHLTEPEYHLDPLNEEGILAF
jgi:SAM-dependent methyltransferase